MENLKVVNRIIDWLKEGKDQTPGGVLRNSDKVYAIAATDSRHDGGLHYIPKACSGRLLGNVSSEILLGVSVLTVFFVMAAFGIV